MGPAENRRNEEAEWGLGVPAEGEGPDPGCGGGGGEGSAAPLPGPERRAAAAPGTAPGQKRGRGSATRWLLQQEGSGQHRGSGSERDPGAGGEPRWPGRPRSNGRAGRSPQRSQHCPSGRRASWQAAWGQRPPRGWSSAVQIHGCTWKRGSGAQLEGGGGQTAARGPCTPGGEEARDPRAPRPWAPSGRYPSHPNAGPPHLGVAADAARRVRAGLGVHAQRARPVEAQAACAGRQEGSQVLVARERLRWPGTTGARPRTRQHLNARNPQGQQGGRCSGERHCRAKARS